MVGGERLSRLGAFSPQVPDAESLHKGLAQWNHRRLSPEAPSENWGEALNKERRMKRLEGDFIEEFQGPVAPLVQVAPQDPEEFVGWFEALKDHGSAQSDPLWARARPLVCAAE